MGCCTGIEKEILLNKSSLVELEENEIRENNPQINKSFNSKEENSDKSDALKNLKTSSKLEVNKEIIVSNPKHYEKKLSPKDKLIKNTAKKLKQITDIEVKNLQKFFI